MMTAIKDVYEGLMLNYKLSQFCIVSTVDIYEMAWKVSTNEDKEEQERIAHLFLEASDRSQMNGFNAGFRFAVALMAECLVEV